MNDKQKQQSRERSRRYREMQKTVTEGVTIGSVTESSVTVLPQLIPENQIPSAVVRPQVERDGRYDDARVGFLHGIIRVQNWQESQVYAELFYRLTHWSLEKLKSAGHWIPVWREALG